MLVTPYLRCRYAGKGRRHAGIYCFLWGRYVSLLSEKTVKTCVKAYFFVTLYAVNSKI